MPHTRASGGDLIWRPTRLAIYARDGWRCVICGWAPTRAPHLVALAAVLTQGWPAAALALRLRGTATQGLTLDHVRPPSRGGRLSDPRNLVTLCLSCNSSKKARPLAKWNADAVPLVRSAVKGAVDRPLGRVLCDELYPGWRSRRRVRGEAVHP